MARAVGWLLFIVMLVSCGDGDKSTLETPTNNERTALATRAFPSEVDQELIDALLTPADLGDGWSLESVQSTEATVADSIFCGTTIEAPPMDAAAILSNQKRGVFLLIQAISQRASAEDAASFMAEVRDASQGCDSLVSTDGVNRTEWTLHDSALQAVGDEMVSVRSTGTLDSNQGPIGSEGYFAYLRYGNRVVVIGMAYLGEANPLGMTEVLRIVDQRMTALN